MATGHTYYQPNDYEQMMIAQGWITPADCDPDYQEYAQKAPRIADGEVMSYVQWLNCKREWDRLNTEFETEFGETYPNTHDTELRRRADKLLRDMDMLETVLGY